MSLQNTVVPLLLTLFVGAAARAEDAPAPPLRNLEVRLTLSQYTMLGGFTPAAVVRPGGDVVVSDLPNASTRTELFLHAAAKRFMVEFMPFMYTAHGMNGPKVVGLHYAALLRPLDCAANANAGWGVSCLAFGYEHRSAHNQDDGTYGWTYANGVNLRARLHSTNGGRSALWLRGTWYSGGNETPFAFTRETAINAADLENRTWVVNASNALRLGDGELFAAAELRGSSEGPASWGGHVRYLHGFRIAVSDVALTVRLGVQGGIEGNLRKAALLGHNAPNAAAIVSFPLVE